MDWVFAVLEFSVGLGLHATSGAAYSLVLLLGWTTCIGEQGHVFVLELDDMVLIVE